MGNFDNIFGSIMSAKKQSGYAPRLPEGMHQLILKLYKTQQSTQDTGVGTFLTSEYLVVKSTNPELRENDARGCPWYIESKGYAGQYAQSNAKEMIEAVMRSIDLDTLPKDANGHIVHPVTGALFQRINPTTNQPFALTVHDTMTIGQLMIEGFFRGIQVAAEVTKSFNKKTKQMRVDDSGKPYLDVTWKAVPGQTLETLAQVRAYLESVDPTPAAPAPAPVAQPAPAPVAFVAPVAAPVAQVAPIAPIAPPPAAAPAPVTGGLGSILAGLKRG